MKRNQILKKTLVLILVLAMVLPVLSGCDFLTKVPTETEENTEANTEPVVTQPTPNGTETTEPGGDDQPSMVGISVSAPVSEIRTGETVTLTVDVTNAEDKSYTWSVSKPEILKVENNVVSVIGELKIDTIVVVTATSVEDPNKSASKTFIVRAPIVQGQVGELTAAMLAELGNPSITVSGILTDYYVDYNQASNSSTHVYDMTVEMADGAWKGVWYIQGNEANAVTDNYRRGETDGVKDQYGNVGHTLEKLFINKNNQVARETEKDYMSIPAVWEAQHLWNHLSNLNVNKFQYNPEHDRYEYQIDMESEEDLYLMTYLSISLTPMLYDTFVGLYVVVKDGKIVHLVAETEKLQYGGSDDDHPDAVSYSIIDVEFSKVGTTVVSEPTPFEAPEYAQYLTAALETMKNTHNYTYKVAETMDHAPVWGGDYSTDSASNGVLRAKSLPYNNNSSSVGTVGCVGFVTERAILFQETIKYEYGMDDNLYRTTYTGYKDNGNGTYDEFAWAAPTADTPAHFYGTKRVNGSLFSKMPTFDFSANVFEYVSSRKVNNVTRYTFQLRETAITRAVAMELSAYKYATDALASTGTPLMITVDENGNLISATIPFDLVSGTYIGHFVTEYSKVGTTELAEGTFEGYVPRVVRETWDLYTVKDFYYNHTTRCDSYGCKQVAADGTITYDHSAHEVPMTTVLAHIYGDSIVDVPAPSVLMEVFGDNIYGPFFNWREAGVDADGNTIYNDFVSITTSSPEYDANYQVTNYESIIEELTAGLGALGFRISYPNTDTTGGASGHSNRYVTFIKGDVQIVIENNFTRNFWIYFYQTGAWTLNK